MREVEGILIMYIQKKKTVHMLDKNLFLLNNNEYKEIYDRYNKMLNTIDGNRKKIHSYYNTMEEMRLETVKLSKEIKEVKKQLLSKKTELIQERNEIFKALQRQKKIDSNMLAKQKVINFLNENKDYFFEITQQDNLFTIKYQRTFKGDKIIQGANKEELIQQAINTLINQLYN